jgi:hypothetical protein
MTFDQSVQYKNCGKYLNLSPCKISYFSKVPKYFSYFYSLLLIYSIEKRFKLEKNHRGPFSLLSTQRCSASGPDLARKQPVTVSRAAIADRRSPPVSPLFPQIPLVCSSAWQRRPNCWRRAGHPSPPLYHKDAHVCVCCLEPSRWLWCIVASRHRWPPASALVVPASVGFRSQPLDDKASSRLLRCRPAAALPMHAAGSSCPLAHRGVVSPRYAGRSLSMPLHRHDAAVGAR